MRLALVHLLVLVAVGVATPAAIAEAPPFESTMPSRLGADENGDGLIDYAGSAAEFKEKEARYGGFQVDFTVRNDLCRKSSTYSWRSSVGEIVKSGRAGCSVSQLFPREGRYPVGLEVRSAGGLVERFQREVTVRDWLVVSIGDSVASGEGNPDIPGNFRRARWQSARCHRSAKAGPAQAALGLEAADPETSTTFVHLACSGAQINKGLLGGYKGIDAGESAEPRLLPPQVDELEQISHERHVDAVLLSVGANDVYFGPIVRFCLEEEDCTKQLFEPPEEEEEGQPRTDGPRPLPEVVSKALLRLPGEYANLAQRLSAVVSPSHVVIVDYFDPTRDSNGEFCKGIGSAIPGRALKIDRDEARWAATGILEPLNAKIGEAARSARWTEVTGVADAFRTHGYCADEPWIRRLTESLFSQRGSTFFSRIAGMLHPNEEGHRQEAALIGRDLDTVLYEDSEADQKGHGDSDTVVLVQEVDDDEGESSGEASLERRVLIGLGGVAAAGLLGAGGYAGWRRRRRNPARAGTAFASELPVRPARWPAWESVEAFGALLEDSSSWVHRRVESIEIVDERLVRRRVSVDFTPDPGDDGRRRIYVPIALLSKRILNRFDLRDESGAAVPLATSEQNAAFAAAHMLAIAEEVTSEPPSEQLEELSWRIARGAPSEALAAVAEIATDLEDEEAREALRKSERFRSATTTFANGFAVIVEVEDRSRRRVMKFAYDYAVKSGLTPRERLGLDPVPFRFSIPELGDAASRHMEFVRAEGLEVLDVRLVGRLPSGALFPRGGSGEGGEAHLNLTRMPRGTQAFASVSLRAVRSGILVGGPVLATLSAAALTAAWFALPDLTGNSGGAASILLAVPAALGAYLGSRKPHPLEAAMLWGARGLVFFSGMLAFVGAGALALDSSVEFLRIVIGIVALLSWLPAAGLLVTFLHPRAPTRNDRDTVL